MHSRTIPAALLAALAASVAALPARADSAFSRVASFPVASNLPADADKKSLTSSEIIAASPDGMTLVYSDSPFGAVGFVDIADPKAPRPAGIVKIDGEPTSVAVAGGMVLAGVNTSKSKAEPSGNLTVIDLAAKKIVATCDLGGQPDSVAMSKDGKFVAIAIENERDEELNKGAIPQMPAGTLKILSVNAGAPDCATAKTVDLTGIAEVAPTDPEPEFVAFNSKGEIAVTLQENNHIAIVDAASGKILSHFSAGSVKLEKVDTRDNGAIDFSATVDQIKREPDAVKWLDDDRLIVANEGDYEGGSRGFTIFSKAGQVLFDSGLQYEYAAALAGHYPEGRSDNKGIEPEGLEVATFNGRQYIFVLAERASTVGVYRDTGGAPEFVQILPSGVGPEGAAAIPSRGLFVTANEADLVEDGLARSHVMLYQIGEGAPAYPTIVSQMTDKGVPLGWGALSALDADPKTAGRLVAASDSVYRSAPAIYEIDATQKPALITKKTIVTRDGQPAQKLDIEGIAVASDGGYWLANEGDSAKLVGHGIIKVNAKGEIRQEIAFPVELLAGQTRFGLEGITTVGEGDAQMLVMAVQREWKDDPAGQVKLLAYTPKTKKWSAVRYPLEPKGAGWMGLSEITARNGKLYILERDNLIGDAARVKRVYSVALDDFKPAALDGELPLVKKTLVRDLMGDLKSATNGYVVDKVEGFTIDAAGDAYFVSDNDGVDDSSGETLFVKIGKVDAVN